MSLILIACLIPLISAWTVHPNKYLSGYTFSPYKFSSLDAAQQACAKKSDCGGVTYEPYSKKYSTRRGTKLFKSPSKEVSYLNSLPGWTSHNGKYLSGYTSSPYTFSTITSAQQACAKKSDCGGITYEPYNKRYTTRKGTTLKSSPSDETSWLYTGIHVFTSHSGKYLSGYTSSPYAFSSLNSAQQACLKKSDCGGITYEPYNTRYTTRKGTKLYKSPSGETSWLKSLPRWTSHNGKYLSGYTSSPYTFSSLITAQQACAKKSDCGGITYEPYNKRFTARKGTTLKSSPTDETSWLKP